MLFTTNRLVAVARPTDDGGEGKKGKWEVGKVGSSQGTNPLSLSSLSVCHNPVFECNRLTSAPTAPRRRRSNRKTKNEKQETKVAAVWTTVKTFIKRSANEICVAAVGCRKKQTRPSEQRRQSFV